MEAYQTDLLTRTQQERVRRHLIERGSITPQEALRLYGSFRLGSIIHRLRRVWGKTAIRTEPQGRQGYAKYVLVRRPEGGYCG